MSRLEFPAKALGLLVLTLSAAALAASSANAATWNVKGSAVTKELSPSVAVKEVEEKDVVLLSKIAGMSIAFLCTTLQTINVKLQPEGVVAFESALKFSGCITKLNGSTVGACEPINGGTEPGVMVSKLLKGQLVEHEKTGIVRLEAMEGEILGTFEFSKECAIGSKVNLIGKLTLKDSSLGTEAETHLVSAGPLTELWVISKTEEHKVTTDGSMIFRLGGAHTGLLWSGTLTEPPPPPKNTTWLVKGTEVTSLAPLVTIKELEGTTTALLTTISGTKVRISCTGAQLSGVKLLSAGAIATGSQVSFSGCTTALNEKTSGACEPSLGGIEPGSIKSNSLKGQIVEHGGTGVVSVEAAEGETLAVVETSKECAIGAKIPIIGKLNLKDSSLGTEAETHLVSTGSLTELWAISKTEEHKATIDGSMIVRLASSHTGLLWSGVFVPKPPSGWRIKGSAVTKELSPSVAVQEVEEKDVVLLSKIIGVSIAFLCTTLQTINVKLQPEGVVAFESALKFSGCITKLNGVTSGVCEPLNGGTEPGVMVSKLLKGQIVEHEKTGIVRLEAMEGETLGTFEFSKECAIGSKVNLIGKLTLKDSSLGTEAETHLVSAGPLTELWVISKTEEHKVTTDGSIVFRLGGAHTGLLWSGNP